MTANHVAVRKELVEIPRERLPASEKSNKNVATAGMLVLVKRRGPFRMICDVRQNACDEDTDVLIGSDYF